MARTPIDPEKVNLILIDWRIGRMSQRDIADKHKVSLGVINKICKGVEQDAAAIVNAGIQYNQSLAGQNEQMVNTIESIVHDTVKRLEWLNNAALQNVKEAMEMPCINQQEFRHRGETILKSKEVLVGKTPENQLNIQNNISGQSASISGVDLSNLDDEQLAKLERIAMGRVAQGG